MNRRSFLKRLLGAAGAIAAGPVALELAKKLPAAPVAVDPAWQTALYEQQFIIPSQEVIDQLCMRTVWYWNDLTMKNLTRNVSHLAIKPYYPK